jgi:phosphoribosylglycinamide formyltransferase-1
MQMHNRDDLPRLVVLISGSGTNLQAILDACASGTLPAQVAAVVANRATPSACSARQRRASRRWCWSDSPARIAAAYDHALADAVAAYAPDWIVLAGWMRILTMEFPGALSRPGDQPASGAARRLSRVPRHRAGLSPRTRAGEIDRTGVMVHLVPDEGVDDGPVLATRRGGFRAGRVTGGVFTARMHQVEHWLLVDTLRRVVGEN